jgi:hypothetical protein
MVTGCPLVAGLGLTDFLIARSHLSTGGATGTPMQTSLFAGLVSWGCFTPAQFLTEVPGGAVTLTVVSRRPLCPGASARL